MTRTCCILAVLAGTALADPSAAKPRVEAGVAAYQRAEYDSASREFEAAYELDPDPKWLYAWAQARRLGGRCDLAVPLYERYIVLGPGADNVAAARTGISLCERAKPPAEPPAAPPPQPEKPHSRPPPVEPAPVAASEPSRWYQDSLGNILTVSGVVGIGVGATFLVLGGRSEDAADGAMEREEFIDLLDEATLRRRIGFTCLGVGAGLAVAGVVRYATRPKESPAVAWTVTPTGVLVSGRF